ncbi:amidohydrolase family protein [Fulvivirgaceae bacterium PWU4]|uniref:Amidohydrolase family protein n=2 Tax=Chryseosolibacter histidini TaxID=2782349 RepID=A0AAP2GLI1_9BACT|nr:amidohydrolase family protein [Chryseosolibacter histidini]
MTIDSHQHFWKYNPVNHGWINDEMQNIRRDFLPDQLGPLLREHHIDGCVTVQVDQTEDETMFMLSLAERYDFIRGVVGWIDLRSPDLEERLQHFRQFPRLKGFRHIVQGEPKGFLADRKFIEGVNKLARYNFTYDLLIYHHQLEEALAFVRQVPDVKIVVDHIAKPSIRTGEKTHWELNMAALATFKNVYCKVSGMVTEARWKDWKQEDFNPYLDEVFETFGTSRVMYGSDWPVCLVAASYGEQLAIVQQYIAALSESEKKLVLGENAKTFYNL